MDKVSLERIKTAHPMMREILLRAYTESCSKLTGKSILRLAYVIRTFAEQHNMYKQGRELPGDIVTNADAGLSFHNYGLAFDIVLLVDKDNNGTFESASWNMEKDFDGDGAADFMEVVQVFIKHGFQWGLLNKKGQRWDFPHFQMTFGHKVTDLLERYNKKQLIPGTNYVQL